jgi:hypothetical protein
VELEGEPDPDPRVMAWERGRAMFTQLDPPIPLHVLGKGDGFALAVIDYGQEHNLLWVTAISETGEIWCAPNPEVRMQANWTVGRSPGLAAKASKEALA